jgi:hypothetical protein
MPGRPRVSSTTGTASRDRSVMIPMMQGLAITAQRQLAARPFSGRVELCSPAFGNRKPALKCVKYTYASNGPAPGSI